MAPRRRASSRAARLSASPTPWPRASPSTTTSSIHALQSSRQRVHRQRQAADDLAVDAGDEQGAVRIADDRLQAVAARGRRRGRQLGDQPFEGGDELVADVRDDVDVGAHSAARLTPSRRVRAGGRRSAAQRPAVAPTRAAVRLHRLERCRRRRVRLDPRARRALGRHPGRRGRSRAVHRLRHRPTVRRHRRGPPPDRLADRRRVGGVAPVDRRPARHRTGAGDAVATVLRPGRQLGQALRRLDGDRTRGPARRVPAPPAGPSHGDVDRRFAARALRPAARRATRGRPASSACSATPWPTAACRRHRCGLQCRPTPRSWRPPRRPPCWFGPCARWSRAAVPATALAAAVADYESRRRRSARGRQAGGLRAPSRRGDAAGRRATAPATSCSASSTSTTTRASSPRSNSSSAKPATLVRVASSRDRTGAPMGHRRRGVGGRCPQSAAQASLLAAARIGCGEAAHRARPNGAKRSEAETQPRQIGERTPSKVVW